MAKECFACGETENLQRHHIDGSGHKANPNDDPRNIMLLCPACHMALHAGRPRGRLRRLRTEFRRHQQARREALAKGDLLLAAIHESQMRRLSYIGKYVTAYSKPPRPRIPKDRTQRLRYYKLLSIQQRGA